MVEKGAMNDLKKMDAIRHMQSKPKVQNFQSPELSKCSLKTCSMLTKFSQFKVMVKCT